MDRAHSVQPKHLALIACAQEGRKQKKEKECGERERAREKREGRRERERE